MTAGFGLSIGTVNSVCAATAGDRERPTVRVRRTAITFDSAGGARVGGMPRFAPVVTDFADLTREVEPMVLSGRNWTSADLVAAVASCLVSAAEPEGEPVITYPACYPEQKVAALRHALDWSSVSESLLMPEPVAAVEWLDAEYGVSENGVTLVYDLGGTSLDIAVVRTEADREERGVLGKAVRSHDYGGRPLGAILARYARALSPGAPCPVSKVVPASDTSRLRTWNVRNSLRLVRRCVHAAGLTMRDIDRVLLIGGAARPVEVAQVLDELGRPMVMSPDPAHTVALGAALASARLMDTGSNLGRYARGAAVLSSAAVVSAVAMSAATMLGGGPIGSDGPALEFAPALAGPAGNADLRLSQGANAEPAALSAGVDTVTTPAPRWGSYSPVAQEVSVSPAVVGAGRTTSVDPSGTHCGPNDRLIPPTYADPAQFTNPLPFWTPPAAQAFPAPGFQTPEISLPPIAPSAGPAVAQQFSAPGVNPMTGFGKSIPSMPGRSIPDHVIPPDPAVPNPAASSPVIPNPVASNPVIPNPPAPTQSDPPSPALNSPPAATVPGIPAADTGNPPAGTNSTGPVSNSQSTLGAGLHAPGAASSHAGPGSNSDGAATSNGSASAGVHSGATTGARLGASSSGPGGTNSGGASPGGTGAGTSAAGTGGGHFGGTAARGSNSAGGGGSNGSSHGGSSGGSHGGGHH